MCVIERGMVVMQPSESIRLATIHSVLRLRAMILAGKPTPLIYPLILFHPQWLSYGILI